jgi:hypothetical protein
VGGQGGAQELYGRVRNSNEALEEGFAHRKGSFHSGAARPAGNDDAGPVDGSRWPMKWPWSGAVHGQSFRRYWHGWVVGRGGWHQRGPWRWLERTGTAGASRSLTVGHGPRSNATHEVVGVRRLQLVAIVVSPVSGAMGSRAAQRRAEAVSEEARGAARLGGALLL